MDAVTYLLKEWAVLAQAPVIFLTSTLIVVAFVWAAQRWYYSGRIADAASQLASSASQVAAAEARVKLRDDQIAEYKDKLHGASPNEVRNRIDALELQLASLTPRRLTVDQREKLLGVLRVELYSIMIEFDISAAETRKFSDDLIATFKQAGWLVLRTRSAGFPSPTASGNILYVFDKNSLRPSETAVKHAFEVAGLPLDIDGARKKFVQNTDDEHYEYDEQTEPTEVELLITAPAETP